MLVFESTTRYLAKGSRNWLIVGMNKIVGYKGPLLLNGVEGGTQMMEAAEGYASLGTADAPGIGSVFRVLTALFFVGVGVLRYNGLTTGAVATSTLALRLLENGTYAGTTFQAGLAQPSAPTIFTKTAGAGLSGTKLSPGTRAIVIWRIRSSTGAISIASLPSNVVVVNNGETIAITFPLTSSNGDDRWGIGAPEVGRGDAGPFFFWREIPESTIAASTVNSIARTIEIEFSDGELAGQDLAPIDDYPPPPAAFGGTLNDTGFLDGCYGDLGSGQAPATRGATIVLSLPLRFESWPPNSIIYTPQPPTGVVSRASDGYAYRAGMNTLGALTYTGGDPPISFQLRWPTAGCVAPHNMVIAEQGRLYIFTSQHGLARIGEGDEPDTEWAIPFFDDTDDWNPYEVVMGWDGDNQIVCACHRKMILPYNSANERCCTPLDLTGKIRGNICAAVTATFGELYLATNNVRSVSDVTTTNAQAVVTSPTAIFSPDDVGTTVKLKQASPGTGTLTTTVLSYQSPTQVTLAANVTWTSAATTTIWIDTAIRLYRFNAGTGMVSEAYTPYIAAADESDCVFDVGGAITVDSNAHPVVMRLLSNFNGRSGQTAREWQKRLPSAGFHHLPTEKPNLINARSHALYLQVTGTGGEVALDSLYSVSEPDAMTLA
nr:hypothetical protein [uncultured bacterium]